MRSISSFADLYDQFIHQFASSKRLEKTTDDLYLLHIESGEHLRPPLAFDGILVHGAMLVTAFFIPPSHYDRLLEPVTDADERDRGKWACSKFEFIVHDFRYMSASACELSLDIPHRNFSCPSSSWTTRRPPNGHFGGLLRSSWWLSGASWTGYAVLQPLELRLLPPALGLTWTVPLGTG